MEGGSYSGYECPRTGLNGMWELPNSCASTVSSSQNQWITTYSNKHPSLHSLVSHPVVRRGAKMRTGNQGSWARSIARRRGWT